MRVVRLLGDADGFCGQHRIQRGAPDAGGRCVIGACRHQDRAARPHITRDVVEVCDRQHALARVAVEDDQLEFVEPLLKQFAGRKRDQRQFVDRRAVLLFRGAQNRKMHEIDAGVGFQEVAPGAFPRMRLAGDQEHPQLVAHPVDCNHRTVVDRRQLVLERGRLDLDDVRPGVLDIDVDVDGLTTQHRALVDRFAVAAHRDLGALAADALIVEPVGDGLDLSDDAETGCCNNRDATIAFVLATGDQGMHRGLKSKRRGVRGDVMHPPVGDQESAGDAIDGNV